jgi:hypothetical protein
MARVLNRSTRRMSRVAVVLSWLGLATMAAAFALPGTAMAATPVVSTGAPSGVTETSATLNGTVNPEGETTQYGFYYADGNSTWCTSGGTSGTFYGGAPTTLGFTDSTSHPVSQFDPALAPGQSLCYLVYASNASGTATGSQVTFTTPNPVPVVTTGAASAITGTGATLNGTVNPEGKSSTSYQFEYDFTSSQWCQSGGATGSPGASSPLTALGFSDSTAHAVSATISFGGPGTALCFRLEASNADTSAVGATASFTHTAAVVRTDPATSIVNGGATLNGTINPQGSVGFPGYKFEYAPSSSDLCTSGGTSNSGSADSGYSSFSFTDTSDYPVSAALHALTPSTTYCFRLVSGSQHGSLDTFTTGPPVTLTVHVTGEGLVSPKGSGSAEIDIVCGGGKGAASVGKEYSHCSAGGIVQGTVVTLSAEPYFVEESPIPQARFAGWSGACSGTADTCTVTMSGDMTVGATFEPRSSPPSAAAVNKALAAVLTPRGPAAKIGAILKAGGYPAAFTAPGAGTAQIAWYGGTPGARVARVQKAPLVAKGAKTFTKAGKATIKIKLTAKGKALLKKVKKGHKLALTARGSFTPKGGKKTSKQKSFTLKR